MDKQICDEKLGKARLRNIFRKMFATPDEAKTDNELNAILEEIPSTLTTENCFIDPRDIGKILEILYDFHDEHDDFGTSDHTALAEEIPLAFQPEETHIVLKELKEIIFNFRNELDSRKKVIFDEYLCGNETLEGLAPRLENTDKKNPDQEIGITRERTRNLSHEIERDLARRINNSFWKEAELKNIDVGKENMRDLFSTDPSL